MLLSLLVVVAGVPRFTGLDALSFYADEETSAFPARSLSQGEGPLMPSGMEYRRGLPLTWATALSTRALGAERELSYRLPVAVLGALTIPLLFLLGRDLVGSQPALIAALLLAFSEWHLVFSRQGRMYVPFLFFYVAAALATLRWARGGQRWLLLAASVSFAAASSLQVLGVLGVMFAVIPLAFEGWSRVGAGKLLAFAGAAATGALLYNRYFVVAPFERWRAALPVAVPESNDLWLPAVLTSFSPWTLLLVMGGAGLGIRAAVLMEPTDRLPGRRLRTLARFGTAFLAGGLIGAGQLYGAALVLLVFLILSPDSPSDWIRRVRWPALALGVAAVTWMVFVVTAFGVNRGLRALAGFPFPYALPLAQSLAGVFLLFLSTAVWLALRPGNPGDRGLRVCLLAGLLPILAIGMASQWGGIRYLFPAYPFILLSAAAGLTLVLQVLGRFAGSAWRAPAPLLSGILLAVAGVLGGHGLPQAVDVVTLAHGEPVNRLVHMYPFRPDHKGPGEFVRGARAAGDVVIAEDPLQQRWYAGRVDFWLRNPADTRKFLYRAADGRLRDMYVSSALLSDRAAADSLLQQVAGRVWLITSGETYDNRSYYLTPEQHLWLDSLEVALPAEFTGRDGVTKVYCLNCRPTDKME